jgi:hypothetical protein
LSSSARIAAIARVACVSTTSISPCGRVVEADRPRLARRPIGGARIQVDRRYPFAEIPAAIGYLEQGHARGKVVVQMA